MNNLIISYAMDFSSFLIQNLEISDINKINSIILFGSAARGDAKETSDVDIFIEVIEENKKLYEKIMNIKNNFFNSMKFKKYWALIGIKNEIQIIIGNINNWKLKNSMPGNSIIFYQRYSPKLESGTNKTILSWEVIKNNSHRVMLNKKLFGYNYYNKRYKGLIETYHGKKIGANVILIPTDYLNLFIKEFHKFNIPVKINTIFEYEK